MMAGFQNVDTSLMEAAKIDGASLQPDSKICNPSADETHAIGLRNIVRIGMYETF